MFGIRILIIVRIKYACAHILDTELRIPVDLHFEKQRFISKLFIYLFIYLFVHLFVCIYYIYLFN